MNYFVEGLQGSGKSTLVKKLSQKYCDYMVIQTSRTNVVDFLREGAGHIGYCISKKYREKETCKKADMNVSDHFAGVSIMIEISKD